jgi:membrane-associated protease RseP (regulator of RpoE activity)
MNKKTLAICILLLFAGGAFAGWKAMSARANAATESQEKKEALRENPVTGAEPDDETDEIMEFTKTLPPPKSMTGAAGACAYVIHNVLPGSPAELAGLKVGDLLTSVDDKQISSDKVMLKLTKKEPGTQVTFHVRRYNFETKELEQFKVTLPLAEWKYPRAD